MDKWFPLLALKHAPKDSSWGLNGTKYWRLLIVEYLQPHKFKERQNSDPIYQVSCFSLLGDASCFHVFPGPSFTFCPGKNNHVFGKNTTFPGSTRKIMCRRGSFWKAHYFRGLEENIRFPGIFLKRSSFIFRLTWKIIFSPKRNVIFPDNTRKIIFRRYFFGKTICSGRPEKENMVFRAVSLKKYTIT